MRPFQGDGTVRFTCEESGRLEELTPSIALIDSNSGIVTQLPA
jgi:hypothetical protein